MTQANDTVIRAMTDDGAFRVIVAASTETVRGAVTAQGVRTPTAERFGDLLTGTVLVRETMAPTLRVQGILSGAGGRGRLVADAHPDGTTRGLVQAAEGDTDVAFGDGSVLEMMRTLPSGALHRGLVEVPVEGGVSRALMAYMQQSEQVASMIAVATVVADGAVVAAGGYIVQLLPEVGRGPLMVMAERLRDFEDISGLIAAPGAAPEHLLGELLYAMPYTVLEHRPLRFGCKCSSVAVVSSLATLPREDIEELVREGEVLEVSCDYCNRDYKVAPAQLRGLLEQH